MRRSWWCCCAAVDIDGRVSNYYPKFRPRRVVMPVDPNSVHDNIREPNQLKERSLQQDRLRRVNERRGALQLATVSQERSAGDAMRMMLETCEKNHYFQCSEVNSQQQIHHIKLTHHDHTTINSINDSNNCLINDGSFIPRHMQHLHELVQKCKQELLKEHLQEIKIAELATAAQNDKAIEHDSIPNDEINVSDTKEGSSNSSSSKSDSNNISDDDKRIKNILVNSMNCKDATRRLSPFYTLALLDATQYGDINDRYDNSSCCSSNNKSNDSVVFQTEHHFIPCQLQLQLEHQQEEEQQQKKELAIRKADQIWNLLDKTPLNAPVHGILAKRGKALVERTICELVYSHYPRMRSKHIQRLLHQTCGLLPCGEIARRVGFTEVSQTLTEVQLWRELNTLTERLRVGQKMFDIHSERLSKGVAQQRRWYWRAVQKSARDRLRLFPVSMQDIQPRLEWIRHFLFAFVAFVELAEQSGDVHVQVQPLIYHLFCPTLAYFIARQDLLAHAKLLLSELKNDNTQNTTTTAAFNINSNNNNNFNSKTSEDIYDNLPDLASSCCVEPHTETKSNCHDNSSSCRDILADNLWAELTRLEQLTEDEEEVLEGKIHPLNQRAAITKGKLEASAGQHAIEGLKNDVFSEYEVKRHRHQAPAILVHATQVQNALKEAQIILKYAPGVSPTLQRSPIDVDQVIHKVTEVHETNVYLKTADEQQFRQVEYTVCRLYAGKYCLGEGKGETLMQGTQEAALQMVGNYYFNKSNSKRHTDSVSDRDNMDDIDSCEWAIYDEAMASQIQREKEENNDKNEKRASTTNYQSKNFKSESIIDDDDNNSANSCVRIHPPRSQEEVAF